jgi:hypothetical protein
MVITWYVGVHYFSRTIHFPLLLPTPSHTGLSLVHSPLTTQTHPHPSDLLPNVYSHTMSPHPPPSRAIPTFFPSTTPPGPPLLPPPTPSPIPTFLFIRHSPYQTHHPLSIPITTLAQPLPFPHSSPPQLSPSIPLTDSSLHPCPFITPLLIYTSFTKIQTCLSLYTNDWQAHPFAIQPTILPCLVASLRAHCHIIGRHFFIRDPFKST